MRAAVLGAGFQGVCVALELARRGVTVDLYDKNDRPITQAGYVNEGKIHLGFVYANDPSMRTAELMIRGALSFRRLLERWLELGEEDLGLSQPFFYAVHRNTMIPVDRLREHFRQVRLRVIELARRAGLDYLGSAVDGVCEELSPEVVERLFDSDRVVTAFRTIERSVNVSVLTRQLRNAVEACPGIRFRPRTTVTRASLENGGVVVETARGRSTATHDFDHAVNALWDGRLAIDATMGLRPGRPWLYRWKYRIRLPDADRTAEIPSTTIVLGRFGDIVRFAGGDLYLSWYPVCLAGLSTNLRPPKWPRQPDEARRRAVCEGSFRALAEICPALLQLDGKVMRNAEVSGGVIVAWGSTDIDDIASELHTRFDIGPCSIGRYHSINTGKYCVAPMFAVAVADRICEER